MISVFVELTFVEEQVLNLLLSSLLNYWSVIRNITINIPSNSAWERPTNQDIFNYSK